eukprot:5835428-Karenia_brevis.AAC.1
MVDMYLRPSEALMLTVKSLGLPKRSLQRGLQNFTLTVAGSDGLVRTKTGAQDDTVAVSERR